MDGKYCFCMQTNIQPSTGTMQAPSSEFKTLVDVGAEVLCQARVPDTSRIFISIGAYEHTVCLTDTAASPSVSKCLRLPKSASTCSP